MEHDYYSVNIMSGLFGVCLYLGAYALLQLGVIRGRGYIYPLLNITAAACVLISLSKDFNLSSALIQISFISISAIGIARYYYIRNRITFSGQNARFINSKFPNLEKDIAQKFLESGEWLHVPSSATLVRHSKKVTHLYYIDSGEAEVIANGKKIALCNSGDFVGEITCFNKQLPTATVTTSKDTRLYRIDISRLAELCKAYPVLRTEFDKSVAENLRDKIARNNGSNWKNEDRPEKANSLVMMSQSVS